VTYSITCDRREGYLLVRVQGPNTPETIRRYLEEMLLICLQEKCPNVLVEEALVGERLNLGSIFQIIEEKSPRSHPGLRLVAFVDVNASNPSNMKFAETVAYNRGVSLRVFETVAEAEVWMRGKLESPPKS